MLVYRLSRMLALPGNWGFLLSVTQEVGRTPPCLHSYVSGAGKEESLSKSELIYTKVL